MVDGCGGRARDDCQGASWFIGRSRVTYVRSNGLDIMVGLPKARERPATVLLTLFLCATQQVVCSMTSVEEMTYSMLSCSARDKNYYYKKRI